MPENNIKEQVNNLKKESEKLIYELEKLWNKLTQTQQDKYHEEISALDKEYSKKYWEIYNAFSKTDSAYNEQLKQRELELDSQRLPKLIEIFKKYIALVKDDKSIFSAEEQEQLKSVAINPGEAFLTGQSTSALTNPVKENVTVEDLKQQNSLSRLTNVASNIGSDAIGTVSSISNVAASAASAAVLVPTIVTAGVTYATELFGAYAAEVASYFVSIPIHFSSYIVQRTTFWFNETIEDPKEILSRLNTEYNGLEDKEKSDQEEAENQKQQMVGKIAEKLESFQQKFSDVTDKIKGGCEKISAYIQEGPEWLNTQIKTYVGEGFESTKKFVGEHMVDITNEVEATAENIAKTLGTGSAKTANKVLEKTLVAAVNKVNKETEMAKQKSNTLIAKGMFQLKGLLGA